MLLKSLDIIHRLRYTNRYTLEGPEIPTCVSRWRLVPPGRFELPTCGLGNRRSIQLSYRGVRAGAVPVPVSLGSVP